MGRGSFWDRMEKIGAEKNAARKEKEEQRAKAKATPRTRSTSPRASTSRGKAAPVATGRVKVVWTVRNHMGDAVESFPYPEKEAAEAFAARRTEETDKSHYVQSDKVPIDD